MLQVSEGLVLCDAVFFAVAGAAVIITKEGKVVLEDVGHLVLLQSLITPEQKDDLQLRLKPSASTASTRTARLFACPTASDTVP